MRANAAAIVVKDTLASVLPALLTAAGLDDFDEYVSVPPKTAESKTLGVYVAEETYSEFNRELGLLVQAQLFRERDAGAYHDVIYDAILRNVTPQLVGMQSVQLFEADIWPPSRNINTSYIYYELTFVSDLDNCYPDDE